jgi:ferrous iron transport protein A
MKIKRSQKMRTTLNLIPAGQAAIIEQIKAEHVVKERLESLGLINGVEIAVVRKAPLGSTRIYRCLNTLIALRSDIAKMILVEVPDGQK